ISYVQIATQGLIAHGRGEAFDYLIGERTTEEAKRAQILASLKLIEAARPVISVNGNVGALVPGEMAELSTLLECPCEVNIFHRTEERVSNLVKKLEESGCPNVLGSDPDERIPGLDHARALCSGEGIFNADVILVPLEDGDRCKALKAMKKTVITIDLNPLSRTSRTADITIVDNLVRAIPNLITFSREASEKGTIDGRDLEHWRSILREFDNLGNMDLTLKGMVSRFR
ncbi:MAG: phosphopantothenate/pantothenate synthetase, partial [Candidatus Thermoplasmatota archaeon]|nr:phosphopantothenate/pantothenate synthetase [Candidatus Thermoplasmatota archaeon]